MLPPGPRNGGGWACDVFCPSISCPAGKTRNFRARHSIRRPAAAKGFLLFARCIDPLCSTALSLLAQGEPAAPPNGIGAILNNPLVPLVGLFFLFYFIFIVPERRRKADEAKMMAALKKNDRIITVGGIHGTIVSAPQDSDVVTIKIDEAGTTRVKLNRSAVARVVEAKISEPTAPTKA